LIKKPSDFNSVQLIEIADAQAGQRLDNFLLKTLRKLPRSRLYRIIRKGEVRVNKKRAKPEYKLRLGDVVRIPPLRLDSDQNDHPVIIDEQLVRSLEQAILFENKQLLVVNKPSGLAVHAGSGLRYGVIDIFRQSRPQQYVELVHRLDRDTSGCLVLAKNRDALVSVQQMLQTNDIRKNYVAIVKGHWRDAPDKIDLPLKREMMPNGENRIFIDERGQQALTWVDQVTNHEYNGIRFSRVDLHLATGRTHQIRVHCQAQGHELAGDPKYGDRVFNQQMKSAGIKRLMLHAYSLEFPRSAHTKAMTLIAPLPAEFRMLL
jgi:23S rRNA pseudouridine955/2504/2580 synthase